MPTFSFAIDLGPAGRLPEGWEGVLHAAGCDDALLGVQFGRGFADFDREASSESEAFASALAQVQSAGLTCHGWVKGPPDPPRPEEHGDPVG